MKLVVVESPAKAKTIEKYLGPGHRVLASYGHVRDLPAKDGSVNPDEGFAMEWENYADKAKQLKAITDEAKTSDTLILATDPDREGEAISWHVQEVLRKRKALPKDVQRVTFNAITKAAVLDAMAHPRALDEDLIDAYRARRALDYLVGFTLSPVLWRKLPGAKSAGRVQSVALRLVVDREREIEAFKAQEYWSVVANMEQDGVAFIARLVRWRGDKIDRLTIGSKGDADAAKAAVEAGRFSVASVETKPLTRNPPPPFTTSTLQQEAARKLGFSASHTMRIAQALYEDGAITYMRTDGVQMDHSAISAARGAIANRYDASYVPDKPRIYQTKAKNAQEAHEAIRPTDFSRDKAGSGDHARLYDLVWKRAMASQMASARLERTTIELTDGTGQHALRATGQVVLFPGYLALYEEGRDDARSGAQGEGGDDEESRRLPRMGEGDTPAKKSVSAEQHFTQPPPRYSEASLVKKMEELGIGRPSTYASVLQVLKDREYVTVEKNRFTPAESGRLVTAFLERFFERYVSYDYTAGLEDSLDDVSGGRAGWQAVLEAFWRDFKPKTVEVMEQKPSEVTAALDVFLGSYLFPEKEDGSNPRLCPVCHEGNLALRGGKFGAFIACSNYPECKYTRRFAQAGGAADAGADTGPVVLGTDPATGEEVSKRSGRFGPYVQLGDGKEAKRSSIPKDVPQGDDFGLEWALKLLSLPRTIGNHPETGNPITASIGRYGPYLQHDGKYGRLQTTADVFETGMNAAVVKLAEAAAGGGRGRGAAKEPLNVFGESPETGKPVKLMEGRFGPYVTDGVTNATLPKTADPGEMTLADALTLLAERAAKGPPKGKKPARKAAAKKPAVKAEGAKKPAVKKTAAGKASAKKALAKKTRAVTAAED